MAHPSKRKSSGFEPEVVKVLHPALPTCPGHEIWKRDFLGSSGLFSVLLAPCSQKALGAFLDGLELFGMGFSWGGFESLVIPFDCKTYRTATSWAPGGPALRFSIGLEAVEYGLAEAGELIVNTRLHGLVPEPIRLAHLIAGGLTTGRSRGPRIRNWLLDSGTK